MLIGLAMESIAFGIAIGVALGIIISSVLEKKYNSNPISLTEEEKRILRRNLIIALVLGVLVFGVGIAAFFFLR